MIRTRSAAGILAIAAFALAVGAGGCRSVEREERYVRLAVQTTPAGAEVSAMAAGSNEARKLGKGPLSIDNRLVIVHKAYPDGEDDYWLHDPERVLPPNPAKPSYASPAYAAGNDYPLDLTVMATLAGHTPAAKIIRIGRHELRRMFTEPVPAIAIDLKLAREAAGGATPGAGESMPKPQ